MYFHNKNFIHKLIKDWCEMVSHCSLMCISLTTNHVEHLTMSMDHLYVLFGKVSIQVLCSFFNWVICFVVFNIASTLYILDTNPLSDLSVNMFSHSVRCLFVDGFLCCAKALWFDVVQFLLFSLPEETYQKKYYYE